MVRSLAFSKTGWICIFLTAGIAQLYAAFPGYLSHDSAYQWLQARNGEITSLWPPGSVYLLRVFDSLWVGPHGVFVLQIVVYWIGATVLTLNVDGALRRTIVGLLFLIAPTMWICIAHVWSDVQLAVLLLLSVAICCVSFNFATIRMRRCAAITATGILLFAALLRHNAIIAAAPLFAIAIRAYAPHTRRKSVVIGTTAATLFAAGFVAMNVHFVSTIRADNFALTQIWDIQAISVGVNKNLFPVEISPNTSIDDLSKNFAPTHALQIYYGSKAIWANAAGGLTPSQRQALGRAWFAAIANNPKQYIAHRGRVIWAMLGRKVDPKVDGAADERHRLELQDNPRYELRHSVLLGAWHKWSDYLKTSYWATPLVWIGAIFVSLLLTMVARALPSQRARNLSINDEFAVCVGLSASLYLASFVVTAPAADLRYMLWPAVASIAAIACAWSAPRIKRN
jgi:hypothetical protein